MRIVNYLMLSGSDHKDLEATVTAAIRDGWQPLGAPVYEPRTGVWFQALVAEDE